MVLRCSPHLPAFRSLRPNALRGFTLIEVAIAVGIVAFVFIALLGLTSLAVQGAGTADFNAKLSLLMGRLAASCQAQPFSTVAASLPATQYYDINGTPEAASNAYFTCEVTDVTPASTSPNLKLLRVRISWPGSRLTSNNESIISICNFQ